MKGKPADYPEEVDRGREGVYNTNRNAGNSLNKER